MGTHSRKERGAPRAIVADQVQRYREGKPYLGHCETHTPVASVPAIDGRVNFYRFRDGTQYVTDPRGAFRRLTGRKKA